MQLRVATAAKLLAILELSSALCAPAIVISAQIGKAPAPKGDKGNQERAIWMLAGREGECAPLSILAKKGPAYANIKSPDDFAAKLRANGHKATLKEFEAGTRPAVGVSAPSAGIHVMFVKKELCDKRPPAPKTK